MPRRLSLTARDMWGEEAEGWGTGRRTSWPDPLHSFSHLFVLCLHIAHAYDSEERNASALWPSCLQKTKGQEPGLMRFL